MEKIGKEKSNFSVTCSLLSQYLKEKGSFGEVAKGIFRPPTTMSLLPGTDVSGGDKTDPNNKDSDRNATKSMDLFPQKAGFGPAVSADKKPDTKLPGKADQLTIFYGGKVLVFDNFPAEKAKDLMELAGKGSSTTTPVVVAPPSTGTNSLPAVAPNCPPKPAQPNSADLPMPIARKASLHRFLEKRKDRINAKAPYQMNGSPATVDAAKPEGTKAWLGLCQEAPKPSLSLGAMK